MQERELGKQIKVDKVKVKRKQRALADFNLCNDQLNLSIEAVERQIEYKDECVKKFAKNIKDMDLERVKVAKTEMTK